jgi:hypothetical protein
MRLSRSGPLPELQPGDNRADPNVHNWRMGCKVAIIILLTGSALTLSAGQVPQIAKIVSIKKHAQGRIVSWANHAPLFDRYPFYDVTLEWSGKKYVVRYESMTGYYPKAWDTGNEIQVKRERGQFILYNRDEATPARVVNPQDCVSSSSPPAGLSALPQIPCD